MKKFGLIMATLLFSVLAMAQSATQPSNGGLKLGVVDIRQVLQSTPQLASAQKSLQSEFASRDKDIQNAQQQMQTDLAKLNRDNAVMSASDKTALTQKIQGEQQKLQTMKLSLQKDLYTKQSQEMQKILDQMQGVIAKVAQQKNLNLVVTKDAVAFASNDVDITKDVIAAMK